MTQAVNPEQQIFVPSPRVSLESVPQPPISHELFPSSISDLSEETIRTHDKDALLAIGKIGLERSFTTLSQWVINPHTSETAYREAINSGELTVDAARTAQAARYISKLRLFSIVPPVPRDGSPDTNVAIFRKFSVYQRLSSEVQRDPLEPHHHRRLQVARISITAYMLDRKRQAET